jgi:hypothetical protein
VGTHFLSSFVPAVRNCPVVAHRCASPSRDYCPGYGTVGHWNHTPHAAHVGQNSKILCRKFSYWEVRPHREAPLPAKGLVRRLRPKPGNSWANRAGRTGKGRFRRAHVSFSPYRKPVVRTAPPLHVARAVRRTPEAFTAILRRRHTDDLCVAGRGERRISLLPALTFDSSGPLAQSR